MQGDLLKFNAIINYDNTEKELAASGNLYKSYKQDNFINSVVGDLEDSAHNFKVLLFEIYNDSVEDKVITDKKYENSPHLKIYLTDQEGNILLFEVDIPEELGNVEISTTDRIDTEKDFFWFINVIQPYEQKEIPTDKKLNSNPTVVESANSGSHQLFKYTDISGANTGHHLLLQTTVQYESSTGTSATANGVMKIKWDVYYDGLLYDSNSKDVTFQYTVSK